MAQRVQRGRDQAYDNIAVGSAITSQEKTIAGALPPVELTGKWLDNLAVGSPPPTTVIADDIVVGTVTAGHENVKVGG